MVKELCSDVVLFDGKIILDNVGAKSELSVRRWNKFRRYGYLFTFLQQHSVLLKETCGIKAKMFGVNSKFVESKADALFKHWNKFQR